MMADRVRCSSDLHGVALNVAAQKSDIAQYHVLSWATEQHLIFTLKSAGPRRVVPALILDFHLAVAVVCCVTGVRGGAGDARMADCKMLSHSLAAISKFLSLGFRTPICFVAHFRS